MNYSEKLKDPKWQRKRLAIFSRDQWKCAKCGSENRTLHIHHKKYIKNANPWEYEDHFLMTLCYICHEKEHNEILEPERKHEHLIIFQEEPEVINLEKIKLLELQNKLLDRNITEETKDDILGNIIFIRERLKELLSNSK